MEEARRIRRSWRCLSRTQERQGRNKSSAPSRLSLIASHRSALPLLLIYQEFYWFFRVATDILIFFKVSWFFFSTWAKCTGAYRGLFSKNFILELVKKISNLIVLYFQSFLHTGQNNVSSWVLIVACWTKNWSVKL